MLHLYVICEVIEQQSLVLLEYFVFIDFDPLLSILMSS